MSAPRHVVVVGGAGAIGSVVASVLAEQGMRVTVADFADPAAVVDALPGTGHAGLTIDVTDRENVLAALGPAASVATTPSSSPPGPTTPAPSRRPTGTRGTAS
jgi:NAD(P)-dependent dehydrogenase (short-subunit alcohol dehydrogenase family)